MISSNTRASRSASRYSSPAQPPAATWTAPPQPKDGGSEGSRALMARWLEPSVQTKPSFEEAGLMRYGVLENMAPLGVMPRPRKPGGESGSAVRRIILRPSGAAALANAAREQTKAGSDHTGSDEAGSDKAASEKIVSDKADSDPVTSKNVTNDKLGGEKPTSHPPPPPPTSPPGSPSPPVPSLPQQKKSLSPKDQEPEDDEYDPRCGARRRRSKRVSLPAKKMRQTPDEDAKDLVVAAKTPTPKKRQAPAEAEERGFADKVVEAAVDEALKHYRYPTAWAMRTLYDERCDDADFVAMVEDVFRQTADAETREQFARLIQQKKREGKKNDQGCHYFVPPSTSSRLTSRKPRAAPYASLLLDAEGVEQGSSDGRSAKRPKTSHTAASRKTPSAGVVVVKVRSPRSAAKQHARRGSDSSTTSSLSSAMSLSSPEASVASPSPCRRAAAVGEASGAQAHGQADAPKCQPITTRGQILASSKPAVSNTSESNSPPRQPPGRPRPRHASAATASAAATAAAAADDADSMPGRLAASELFPTLPAKLAKHGAAKPSPVLAADEDPFWNRRRDARNATAAVGAQESSVRTGQDERIATPPRTTRRTRQLQAAPASMRSTRSASKRPIADVAERTTWPAAFSWQGDGSPAAASRAATPPSLRPTKKQRTGLRVKTSPVKKKGGTAAGVPRSMSEANSTLNNGAPKDSTSDNDEYCSACGNAGDVVCCDGCPRSFHFECVDMVQSDDLPDEWYCNECLIRRFPSRVPVHKGIFAGALNNLEKSIPRAFSLPKKVQSRFEGVKAGADGDYEDVTASKTTKKRNGYDELPDFFKQREDGRAVLCHACQKPATDVRAILLCSACPLHWHIDCLDPPLAVPPVLKTWRCPAHVDDVLIEVPGLAPAHRFRRLKGAQAITPALGRGLRNNGHIDIDWTDEADPCPFSGWPDPSSFGRSYKLPASGVVLDFIEQLRRQGAGYGARRHESKRIPYPLPPVWRDPSSPLPGSALERDIDEMQASLTLIGLRQKRSEPIDRLTSALLSAADDNVLSLMAKSNADNVAFGRLTPDDKQGLRALLAQMNAIGSRIRQVLGEDNQACEPTAAVADARTPVSEPSGLTESGKLESMALVAEPTPPSTVDHAEGSMELD